MKTLLGLDLIRNLFVFFEQTLTWLHLGCTWKRVDVLDLSKTDLIVFLNVGIESVFDFVFRPARKVLANLRPLTTDITVQL